MKVRYFIIVAKKTNIQYKVFGNLFFDCFAHLFHPYKSRYYRNLLTKNAKKCDVGLKNTGCLPMLTPKMAIFAVTIITINRI
jgi:hypothetical protein